MASCSTWAYRNVTPAVFQVLRKLAQNQNITIPNSPSGKFTVQVAGVKVGFSYKWDGKGMLALTCTSKPALVSCSMIKNYADGIVTKSGGRTA